MVFLLNSQAHFKMSLASIKLPRKLQGHTSYNQNSSSSAKKMVYVDTQNVRTGLGDEPH